MKWIVIFILASCAAYLGLRPESKKKLPFSIEAISSKTPCYPVGTNRLPTAEEEKEVASALSQSYRYLGSGGQCYAFVSEDDRYVIKFFKQKSFDIPSWIQWCPLSSLKEKQKGKKERKRAQVFEAFTLSFDEFPKETGILYTHLNKTSHLNRQLSFCDAKETTHKLHLDDLEFVIQKKAELAFTRIDTLMLQGDIEGAKKAIDQLLKLPLTLARQGYRNRDPNIRSNCGFLGTEAIWIDVGRIVHNPRENKAQLIRKQLDKTTPCFQKYLAANHPELLSYFNRVVNEILPPDE